MSNNNWDYKEDEDREYQMQKMLAKQAMGNNAMASAQASMAQNSLMGLGPLYNQVFLAQQDIQKPVIYGEILRAGSPIQEWRGAEYEYGHRSMRESGGHRYWQVDFVSPYCGDVLFLNLDADKHSGEDADRIAKTMLEALNQRRLG